MNKIDLQGNLSDCISAEETIDFKYDTLEAQTQTVILQRTNEIKAIMRRTSQDIIHIGQKLIEIKQYLGHGQFIKWLKSEFNWSISSATKFMQVAQQFEFVNFTNLNITASALYLIAAPSVPKKIRAEILERASSGENISYTKVKTIIDQHKKTTESKSEKTINVDISPEVAIRNSCISLESKHHEVESKQHETSVTLYMTEDLIRKEAQASANSLSLQNLPLSAASEYKEITTTIKDIYENTTQMPNQMENITKISSYIIDAIINEMAISIMNLTPKQLALVVIKSVNAGLSKQHLKAIITSSQILLNQPE